MADRRNHQGMRPRSGLLILIGICLFLLLLSSFSDGFNNALRQGVDRVLMPMQKGMNRAGSMVFGKLEKLSELSRVQDENLSMREELALLREENARLKLKEEELSSLRGLLELGEQYPDYPVVGAHVIGKNSGNWYQSFLIDKGSADGLALNMNVIADGGLVGIITSIGENYATVSTIINDNQYVSAMSARTQNNFLVAGDLKLYAQGLLKLEDVGKFDDVQVGDMVVTSNISELYLPGLLIGYVDTIEVDSNRLQQSGTLLPVARFDDLDIVLVITELKNIGEDLP